MIVLGVLAFAVVSIGAGTQTMLQEKRSERGFETSLTVGPSDQTAQLYLDAEGLEGPPIVYAAKVQLQRWQGQGQRVVEALVDEADPVEQSGPVLNAHVPSFSVARQISQRLKGRRVLAAVTPETAKRLTMPGEATVRLVVTPQGETATLLIDGVVEPGGSAADLFAADTGAVGVTAVSGTAAVDGATVAPTAAASTRPVVSSLSRYFGRPGTIVTITGKNFGRPTSTRWVTCGGVRATWKSWSSTSITFVVPTKMKRSGYVGVVTPTGTSNGLYYIPFDPPVVSSISPREGAPGSVVTIRGSRFGSSQGTGWVTFAGRSAEVVAWTDTKIVVIIPRGAETGYAGVVANGLVSNGVLYGPYGMPTITGTSSRSVYKGMQVTLRGRDFGADMGRVVCSGMWANPDYWSPTEVRFTVPDSAASGYVGIVRADGVTSNGVWQFVVPRLDTISSWWASPGSTVTLTGAGFGDTPGTNQVFIGGKPAPVVSWTDASIAVRVPDDAVSGYVGVGTLTACSRGKYLLVETRAHVDTVAPRQVRPGDQITLTGTGFGPQILTSRVLIAGSHQCQVLEWSDSRIVAIVPPDAVNGYAGVSKRGVTSNGVWVQVLP